MNTSNYGLFNIELEPYQREAIEWLLNKPEKHKGRILADGVGLGKTAEALGFMETKGAAKVLVITKKFIKESPWMRQIQTYLPHRTALMISGDKFFNSVPKFDYLVVHYEQAKKYIDRLRLMGFTDVIVDECQYIKNRKSQVRGCVRKLVSKPQTVYISAGPVKNNAHEIWSVLNLIHPERFSSYQNFLTLYFNFTDFYAGGSVFRKPTDPKNPEEFRAMLSEYMLRRTHEELKIKGLLPTLKEVTIEIVLSSKQRARYNEMRDFYLTSLDNGEPLTATTMVARITRLKQLCLAESPDSYIGSKWNWLMSHLEDDDEPVVVFSQFASFLERGFTALNDRLECGLLRGGMSDRVRIETLQKAKDRKIRALFVSTLAGGVGLDGLQDTYSRAIFLDLPWVPDDIDQAIGRIYRRGQDRPVEIFVLEAHDTIEQKIRQLLNKKELSIESAMPNETLRKLLSH